MDAGDPYRRAEGFLPPTDDLGLDGYEVLEILGEGGSGRVYRARQDALDRTVAIKVLSASGFREETMRRFERECRAVGAVSGHPNIVTIYDSGITRAGKPYIVMDHMKGGSFGDRLARSGSIGWQRAVEIVVKVAGAVETAHRSGILHRDIKPENILVSGFGEPKLADFGIASIPGGYETHTGAITASLSHAAPEVLEGHKATRAVDIYALGSTLFALITGHAAFRSEDGAGLQGLIAKTLTHPVPDLRDAGVPDEVCNAIEKAMEKDPSRRFGSAEALGAALQRAQASLGLAVTEMSVPVAEGPVLAYATDLQVAASEETLTSIRERRELTPPLVAPPKRRFVWRSPVTAGVIALVLLGSGTGVIALRDRSSGVKRPAAAPAGEVPEGGGPEVVEREDAGETRPAERTENKPRDRRGRSKGGGAPSFGGAYAYGGGSGTPVAPSGVDGTAAPDSRVRQTTAQGDGGGGSASGGGEQKPPPPPPPNEQPATVAFWYFSASDGRYLFTADSTFADDQRARYDNHSVLAGVWDSPGRGLVQLCPEPDRCENAFISVEPPKNGDYKALYFYAAEHGRFWITDPSTAPPGADVRLVGYAR
ncbi:MAG: serine/threonine-protein kinase [Actinomycetota bacterium]